MEADGGAPILLAGKSHWGDRVGTWPSISHSAEALGALIPLPGLFWQDGTSWSFHQKQALLQFSCQDSIGEIQLPLPSHLAWDSMSQCFLIPHPRYQRGSVGSQAFCPDSVAAKQCDWALCFLPSWCQQDLMGSWVYISTHMQWDRASCYPAFNRKMSGRLRGEWNFSPPICNRAV